jgi:hypothetical protein
MTINSSLDTNRDYLKGEEVWVIFYHKTEYSTIKCTIKSVKIQNWYMVKISTTEMLTRCDEKNIFRSSLCAIEALLSLAKGSSDIEEGDENDW